MSVDISYPISELAYGFEPNVEKQYWAITIANLTGSIRLVLPGPLTTVLPSLTVSVHDEKVDVVRRYAIRRSSNDLPQLGHVRGPLPTAALEIAVSTLDRIFDKASGFAPGTKENMDALIHEFAFAVFGNKAPFGDDAELFMYPNTEGQLLDQAVYIKKTRGWLFGDSAKAFTGLTSVDSIPTSDWEYYFE